LNYPKHALILAGGLGTRLREVVNSVPKPMAPINKKPFLEILINHWIEKGIKNFYLLIGYKGDVIKSYFGNKYKDANIFYSIEREQLGTGGAFFNALENFRGIINNEDLILLNGDTWFDFDFSQLIADSMKTDKSIIVVSTKVKSNKRYGEIKLDSKKNILQIKKPTFSSSDSLINTGCYFIRNSVQFNYLNQYSNTFSFEDDFLVHMINQKLISASIHEGTFIDIGIPADYLKAKEVIIHDRNKY